MVRSEKGFLLLEVLVVIVLFAIIGLVIAQSAIYASRSRELALYHSTAAQLALEKLEEFAGKDPLTVTAASSAVDEPARGPMRFRRTVTCTVNSDSSRTVIVDVNAITGNIPVHRQASNTFALWGTL